MAGWWGGILLYRMRERIAEGERLGDVPRNVRSDFVPGR